MKRVQPKRGDIFMADYSNHRFYWQSNKRPVIIIQNNKGNTNSNEVIVVPITSNNKKWLPTHVPLSHKHGLFCDSTARCENIATIEKSRLQKYMGSLKNTKARAQLDEALKVSLGLRP